MGPPQDSEGKAHQMHSYAVRRQELADKVIAELMCIANRELLRRIGLTREEQDSLTDTDTAVALRIHAGSIVAFEDLVDGLIDYENAMRGIVAFHRECLIRNALKMKKSDVSRRKRQAVYVAAQDTFEEPCEEWSIDEILESFRPVLGEVDLRMLRLLALGKSKKEIAEELGIAAIYVRFQRLHERLRRRGIDINWFLR